ncbi:DUF5374 domain-containing protein [Pasteurella sp. P03HT]
MILTHYRGMTFLSLLMVLALFSIVFLSVNKWLAHQRHSALHIYHTFQATQIAINQKQRQFLGLACEVKVIQNDITFQVQCQSEKVTVRSHFTEISL